MEVFQPALWQVFALSRVMHVQRTKDILDIHNRPRAGEGGWAGRVWSGPLCNGTLRTRWEVGLWDRQTRFNRSAAVRVMTGPRSCFSSVGSGASIVAENTQRRCTNQLSLSRQKDSSPPSTSLAGRLLGKAIKLFIRAQLEACGALSVAVSGGNGELLSGQVRELQISARDVVYKGITVSAVELSASSIRLNLSRQDPGRFLCEPFPIVAAAQMNQSDLNASLSSPVLTWILRDLLGHESSSTTISSAAKPATKTSHQSNGEAAAAAHRQSEETKSAGQLAAPVCELFSATLREGTVLLRSEYSAQGSHTLNSVSLQTKTADSGRKTSAPSTFAQGSHGQTKGLRQASLTFHVGKDGRHLSVRVTAPSEHRLAALSSISGKELFVTGSKRQRGVDDETEEKRRRSVGGGVRESELQVEKVEVEKEKKELAEANKERRFSLGPNSRINELTISTERIKLLGDFIVTPPAPSVTPPLPSADH